MNERKKMIRELVELLNKEFNDEHDLTNQYVVGYYKVKDDELIGYHLSSACQLTDELLEGKRYSGDNPYSQLETISENLKYTLNCSEESPGFMMFGNATREKYFKGYTHGDLYLQAVYLADGTPTKPVTFTYKEND